MMPQASDSIAVGPPQASNVEQRLERLEAVTNEILRELKSLRRQPGAAVRFGTIRPGGTGLYGGMQAAQLSAMDQQISAVAAEMKSLQARLADLQAARAKLAGQMPIMAVPRTSPALPEGNQINPLQPVMPEHELRATPPATTPPTQP
jgi:hypothetical protein